MSDERALLVGAADRLFADLSRASAEVDRTGGDSGSRSAGGWAELEASGFGSLLVPEDLGGAGARHEEAGAVIERAGWHTIELPLAETMLARGLLARIGGPVPEGVLTFATDCSGALSSTSEDTQLYSGRLVNVPWGVLADHIVLPCERDGAQGLGTLPTAAARGKAGGSNLAGEARDTLEFQRAPLVWIPTDGSPQELLFELGALARVAQIAGALGRALQLCLEHASTRRQFGKALGDFQVIQHQLALLAEEAGAVSCASAAAYRAADRGEAHFETAAAKTRANQAVGLATAIAHQVHGAIGCTREHALQRVTRRLWAWRSEFGNDRYWAQRLGSRICAAGADRFWPALSALGDGA